MERGEDKDTNYTRCTDDHGAVKSTSVELECVLLVRRHYVDPILIAAFVALRPQFVFLR
jgi:hypothetical protein